MNKRREYGKSNGNESQVTIHDRLSMENCIFNCFGVVGCILAWAWHRYAYDNPADSPYVNEAEAAHINEGRDADSLKKSVAPWSKFLRSTQFWAVGIQFMVVDIYYVCLLGLAAVIPHGST